jgi:hypothetical protein
LRIKFLRISEKFGLLYDGWSITGVHYVAVFAVFGKGLESYYPLLAIAPLLEEDDLGAQSHIDFFISTLSLYKKSMDNIAFFIGDNCSVNQKISSLTGIPLIGCYSHKFNLAVVHYLKTYEKEIDEVNTLMKELRKIKNRAKLMKVTTYLPIKRNVTRWSSVYEMLRCFFRIKEGAQTIDDVIEFIPSLKVIKKLEALMVHLEVFQSVTLKLQSDDLDLSDSRALFDAITEKYPSMGHYLHENAEIVTHPIFENAIVKILNGQTSTLKKAEQNSVAFFLVSGETTIGEEEEKNFADGVINKKRKRVSECQSNKYLSLKFIIPTTNKAERLFSQCSYVLPRERRSMLPVNFEMIIFLKINRSYWNIELLLINNLK